METEAKAIALGLTLSSADLASGMTEGITCLRIENNMEMDVESR